MSIVFAIGLTIGLFVFVVAICSASTKPKSTIDPRELEWFEIQQAAKELGQYPSTLGDKQRFLARAERFVANNRPPVALKKPVETLIPGRKPSDIHNGLLDATSGQFAQVERLSRAGDWRAADALARKAIANSYLAVQPTEQELIGQKLPAKGVLGFEYTAFSITVTVTSDEIGEALPTVIQERDVYFLTKEGRRQRPGPRWDADLIESPYRRQAKTPVAAATA